MFYKKVLKDHLPWLNDIGRNLFYRDAIKQSCTNKVCVDVGSGTGILADYALQYGAKKVYCVEIRKERANYLRKKYLSNDKVIVIEKNFLECKFNDNIDVFIMEQTGYQFEIDILLKKFYKHINSIQNNMPICIPDEYVLDVKIFDGIINENPKFLIQNDVLPIGFYNHAKSLEKISPTEELRVFKISLSDCNKEIEFMLDLQGYKQATIFIDDNVYFCGKQCNLENVYREYKNKPYKIIVEDCKSFVSFKFEMNKFVFSKLNL